MVLMSETRGEMKHIAEGIEEVRRDIEIASDNPILQKGFTQIPNFVLEDPNLSLGAKTAYALFLKYAWYNDYVFPGQERLAKDAGISKSRFSEYTRELREKGLIEVKRRGLGKTNLYKINFRVTTPTDRKWKKGK